MQKDSRHQSCTKHHSRLSQLNHSDTSANIALEGLCSLIYPGVPDNAHLSRKQQHCRHNLRLSLSATRLAIGYEVHNERENYSLSSTITTPWVPARSDLSFGVCREPRLWEVEQLYVRAPQGRRCIPEGADFSIMRESTS